MTARRPGALAQRKKLMRATERRTGNQDRRRRATPLLSEHLLTGRRRSARRHADQSGGFYTDVPAAKAILAGMFIFTLCALDAALSLHLFDTNRAQEANPLMALALGWGELAFVLVKFAFTGIGLFVICAHWNFRVFRKLRIATLSHALIGLYVGLVIYEIALLMK